MTIWLKCFTIAIVQLTAWSSWAQELIKVPVQIPAITPAVTAFAIARDHGYYRQDGLDVQLIVMPSAVGTQALLGGNVKFSPGGGARLLPILRGAPISGGNRENLRTMRPSLTQDGIVNEQLQAKSFEHVVERAGLKTPPPLDRLFDYSIPQKCATNCAPRLGSRNETDAQWHSCADYL